MPAIHKNLLNQFRSDASLVRAYAQGDASAFDMLYSKYKDQVFNSLFHQLGSNQSAAEEVAQEVWMAVIRGASNFKDLAGANSNSAEGSASAEGTNSAKGSNSASGANSASSFKSWLFSIAYRRSADYWRNQYKNAEQSLDPESRGPDSEAATRQGVSSSEQEQYQVVREIRALLAELPDDQRQSFILREEGFSYQEIANITESGVETIKSRLRYARNTLKAQLRDDND